MNEHRSDEICVLNEALAFLREDLKTLTAKFAEDGETSLLGRTMQLQGSIREMEEALLKATSSSNKHVSQSDKSKAVLLVGRLLEAVENAAGLTYDNATECGRILDLAICNAQVCAGCKGSGFYVRVSNVRTLCTECDGAGRVWVDYSREYWWAKALLAKRSS